MEDRQIKKEQPMLRDVKVEPVKHKQRRNTHSSVPSKTFDGVKRMPKVSSRSNDFVYVNSAYVGSLNSINEGRIVAPPTTVIREQYWACSKWSFATKVLAIASGMILGAAIGLAVTLAIRGGKPEDVIGGLFKSSAPD